MTPTVAALRDLNVAALEVAAQGWRNQSTHLQTIVDDLVMGAIGPIARSGWSGTAANLAVPSLQWHDDRIEVAATNAMLVGRTLELAAGMFRVIQERLRQLLEDAARHGLVVTDLGIGLPQADHAMRHEESYVAQREQLATAAGLLRQRAVELCLAAQRLDEQVAEVLNGLQPVSPDNIHDTDWEQFREVGAARAVAELAGYTSAGLPSPGDPQAAAAWWSSVAPQDKQLLLQAFPQQLGALDGLPALDRNTANRAFLDYCAFGNDRNANATSLESVVGLRALLEEADHNRPGQLLLLGFDNTLDGQAVVAIGNPDHAAHTALLVPGTNTELSDVPGQVARANDIRNAADIMTSQPGDVSVVAWLGYNAPEINNSVLMWDRAIDGAPALDAFVNGLNVSHDSAPSHVTALAHSYGSTLVGEAARVGDGLAVSDIVVVGSPGMHVGSVGDLQLDPRHVWAGAAPDDAISGWAGSTPGVHGSEPSDSTFGANVLHVDTSGHGGYWQPGSISLNNQAAIIVGDYEQVKLDHGSVPHA
jgi:hypothetical protein